MKIAILNHDLEHALYLFYFLTDAAKDKKATDKTPLKKTFGLNISLNL